MDDLFGEWDTDGDNKITKDELSRGLANLGVFLSSVIHTYVHSSRGMYNKSMGCFGPLVCFCLFQFGSVWFGLVRFGSVWFGLVRFGSVRFGSVRFVSVWFGSVRFSLVCFSLVCFSLVRFGSVRFSLARFSLARLGTRRSIAVVVVLGLCGGG